MYFSIWMSYAGMQAYIFVQSLRGQFFLFFFKADLIYLNGMSTHLGLFYA